MDDMIRSPSGYAPPVPPEESPASRRHPAPLPAVAPTGLRRVKRKPRHRP